MQGWSKGVIYTAVAMLGAGFLLMVLAWNGAASVGGDRLGIDYTQGQIPYVISGGIGGLALVAGGLALLVVHSLRRDLLRVSQQLEQITDAIRESGAAAGAAMHSTNSDGEVVAGRTSYHLPSCHLVEDRNDLRQLTLDAARDRGLAPCRICNPAEALAVSSQPSSG